VTITIRINDPMHARASTWADWIFATCKPAVPQQVRGGVYAVEIEAERAKKVEAALRELSPGDIEVVSVEAAK